MEVDYKEEPDSEYSRSLPSTSKSRSNRSNSAWATNDDFQESSTAPVPYNPGDDVMNSDEEREVEEEESRLQRGPQRHGPQPSFHHMRNKIQLDFLSNSMALAPSFS